MLTTPVATIRLFIRRALNRLYYGIYEGIVLISKDLLHIVLNMCSMQLIVCWHIQFATVGLCDAGGGGAELSTGIDQMVDNFHNCGWSLFCKTVFLLLIWLESNVHLSDRVILCVVNIPTVGRHNYAKSFYLVRFATLLKLWNLLLHLTLPKNVSWSTSIQWWFYLITTWLYHDFIVYLQEEMSIRSTSSHRAVCSQPHSADTPRPPPSTRSRPSSSSSANSWLKHSWILGW